MKNYPYFIADALLLFVFLLLVPVISIYMGYLNMAIVSVLAFALLFQGSIVKMKDFEQSVRGIKGISSWESDFLSFGTLVFDYRGEKLRYRSALRGRMEDTISVDYMLDAENRSKKAFEIRNTGKGWLDEFEVSGDRRFLSSVKKEISAFNRRYRIEGMRNSDGLLHIVVNLRFMKGKPPSKKAKLDDMAHFLEDYLDLAYKINKRLRK